MAPNRKTFSVTDGRTLKQYPSAFGSIDIIKFGQNFDVSHNIFAEIGEDGRDLTRVTVPGMNAVRGGNEYEFYEPVKSGDVVNRRRKVIDIYEKEGKKAGKILFITYETTYMNQKGTVLGVCRETMMFLK